jgi:hypothetical protein
VVIFGDHLLANFKKKKKCVTQKKISKYFAQNGKFLLPTKKNPKHGCLKI